MEKNRTASLNDTANIELEPVEAVLASMISLSLADLFEESPKLIRNKYKWKYLHESYYPKKIAIERNKKDANNFFDNPNSMFNKYTNLDKEYLIEHYGRKYKTKESAS